MRNYIFFSVFARKQQELCFFFGFFPLFVIPNDKDIKKSRMAIEKYQLPYPQLLNTQDKFAKAYGIVSMPLTIIFAPDGTIIARGLNTDELKAKINEIFPDNK